MFKSNKNGQGRLKTALLDSLKLGLIALIVAVPFVVQRQGSVEGAPSSTLNFQARLLGSSGAIVPDGTYNIEFKLYNVATDANSPKDQGACTYGSGTPDPNCLWTETRTGGNKVTVKSGYLSVYLGSVTGFPSTIKWNEQHWLTMNIGGAGSPTWDGEMSPRIRLTALPYAFQASELAQTSGANRGTLKFSSLANSPQITLPDASGEVCLDSGNCGYGDGDILNGGQAGPIVVGTNDNTSFFLETNNVNRIEIQGDGDVAFDANTLFVDAVNGRVGIGTVTPGVMLEVAGDGDFNGHVAIGDFATPSAQQGLIVAELFAPGDNCTPTTSSFECAGIRSGAISVNAGGTNKSLAGVVGSVATGAGSFTLDRAAALVASNSIVGSGTSITNQYGLYVENMTSAATNDYGVYIQGADTYALFVDDGATRLDGTLEVGTLGTTDTVTYLCRNSLKQLAVCNTTGNGAAFTQGGNAFGATAVLGTTDAQALNLVTGGAGNIRLAISSTGSTTVTGGSSGVALTVNNATSTGNILNLQDNGTNVFTVADGGAVTATGNMSIQGNTTIGDASGDTLTIHTSQVTTPNNLDFVGSESVLFIGTSNRRVGIGTNAPGAKLHLVQNADGIDAGLRVKDGNSSRAINLYYDAASAPFVNIAGNYKVGHIDNSSTDGGQLAASRLLTLKSFNESTLGGIAFDLNGSEMARFHSNGNFGIGDATPTYALTVGNGDLFGVDSLGRVFLNAPGLADNNSVVCRNSANQLAACNSTFATTATAFVQGGNDFGANAVLGTNGAGQTLSFETAGTTRLTLDTSGNATLTGNLTVQGTGTSTFAGNLAVDTDALYVNTAKNQVGIGTATTDAIVHARNTALTGTGTITSTGATTTVTGSGTAFTTELTIGDTIIANGQARTILTIPSNTSLTVTADFNPDVSGGSSFTYKKSLLRLADSGGSDLATIDSLGSMELIASTRDLTNYAESAIKVESTINKSTPGSFYAFDFRSTMNINVDASVLGTDFLFRDWSTRNINTTAAILTDSGGHASFSSTPAVNGTGNFNSTIASITGLQSGFALSKSGTGTLTATNVYGAISSGTVNANTILSNRYGFKVDNVAGAGTVTNQYGLHIGDLTKGATSNYGIYIQGASTNAIWVDSGITRLDGTLDVQSGTITNTVGALSVTSATTTAMTLDSGTTGAVNVGTGGNAKSVTIGNNTGNTSVSIICGTGTCGIGNNGTDHSTTLGSTTGTSATTIQGGTGGAIINTGGTTRATFDTSNNLYMGNGVTAAAPNAFAIRGTGSSTTAVAGGALTLQGGNATVGNANGGNLILNGGTGFGTGVKGLVVIDTPTISTASAQNCSSNCAVTQANVDGNGAVLINATNPGLTATLGDPTITTAGRIMYVTNVGANDFTLSVNGGGTGNTIAMKPNTTATMIWNGSDWTAAGASSSTDLQSAYNNTLTSAGGAELVLNAPGGSADGLTIRNNATSPISGGIFEVQSSIGTNLFSVNNFGTELAANGGSETLGTFGTNWTAAPAGGTVTRTTTAGQFVTGLAGMQVVTTTTNHGVRNNLSANPVAGTTYQVSFTAKLSSGTFTTLDVQYSRDGGTDLEPCTSYSTQTLSTSVWTKITCTITTDGTTAINPDLIIRQTDGIGRTFWIDNLSFMRNDGTTQPSNVQIGGGINGGQVTLFTLDRSTAPPVANGDTTYLGSMYYDTTTGRIQCYESDGWGACGSAPDNIVTLTPEYTGAVLNGSGIGTMTADFCGNGGGLSANTSFCASGEARNYYRWTSPQATDQTYSIYVTYKLPTTFKTFASDSTIRLTAYKDHATNAQASLEVYRKNVSGGSISQCGGTTTVTTGTSAWNTTTLGGAGETTCGWVGGDYVIFKVSTMAKSNANVYIENLDFTYYNQ
ncbi:MAG TPA: carbohydrate binding domain-containing protein [Verrucomicrobiae bacterium]|nr:carbohydrate binding domain-containing protein [Verrucomicrobiae bacterium]